MHTTKHTAESRKKIRLAKLGKKMPCNCKKSKEENGIKLFLCTSCKEFKPVDDYYKDSRNQIGITSQCKKCHCKTSVKTRNIDKTREREKLRARRIRIENPDYFKKYEKKRAKTYKTIARDILNKAIKAGHILKPDCCGSCGRDNVRITGHHIDYNKPLEVEWLCYECHAKLHRKVYSFKLVEK